jgi:hypothetical protein
LFSLKLFHFLVVSCIYVVVHFGIGMYDWKSIVTNIFKKETTTSHVKLVYTYLFFN